jgi:hypothetical protein
MMDGSTNSLRELWNASTARRHDPVAVVIVRQDMVRTKGCSDSWQVVEEAVDGFHAAALRNGGTDNGSSGLRSRYMGRLTTQLPSSIQMATDWKLFARRFESSARIWQNGRSAAKK